MSKTNIAKLTYLLCSEKSISGWPEKFRNEYFSQKTVPNKFFYEYLKSHKNTLKIVEITKKGRGFHKPLDILVLPLKS